MQTGFVSLVGAGPGSADLLTMAAVKAIQQADVILYDALLSADIRRLFPRRAKAIYVGKRCKQHALRQEQINTLLLEQAHRGKRVVRLKGGDPFIFGRGAEELEALRGASIPYQIIPGISSLNGIAAQWALPLSSRTHSNEFRAIQGHSLPQDTKFWQGLADYEGTLVIFMGIERIQTIVRQLLDHGANPDRPLAVIETDEQGQGHVTRSHLALLDQNGFEKKTQGPGIIYIGANVSLMDEAPASFHVENEHEFAIAHFS